MLWGSKLALGSYSGEANFALGVNLLWGSNFALGRQICINASMKTKTRGKCVELHKNA
ncbi:MAG: hypothetical protein KBC30_06525 [Planctomycetes bacterium]|nr:hypothetical protein [Planctomycetota bacterium]HPY76006.1 hypothetical protein [Planctomycetota bacterium]HQB01604.1 hypothetical protein [Planctomycetota bacterium]